MTFYVASRLNNIEQVRYVVNRLKNNAWTNTYDWTLYDSSSQNNPDSLRMIGEKECAGVKAADIVIILTPQGRGTHIELGMAIALGKKVYVYHMDDSFFQCDDNTCAFYWLPQVTQLTGKIENAVEMILQGYAPCGPRPPKKPQSQSAITG